jgi:hypothetical protein
MSVLGDGVEFACEFLEKGLAKRGDGLGAVLFHLVVIKCIKWKFFHRKSNNQ